MSPPPTVSTRSSYFTRSASVGRYIQPKREAAAVELEVQRRRLADPAPAARHAHRRLRAGDVLDVDVRLRGLGVVRAGEADAALPVRRPVLAAVGRVDLREAHLAAGGEVEPVDVAALARLVGRHALLPPRLGRAARVDRVDAAAARRAEVDVERHAARRDGQRGDRARPDALDELVAAGGVRDAPDLASLPHRDGGRLARRRGWGRRRGDGRAGERAASSAAHSETSGTDLIRAVSPECGANARRGPAPARAPVAGRRRSRTRRAGTPLRPGRTPP